MLKHLIVAATVAVIWATPSRADILTNFAIAYGDQSSTSFREPGACWLKSKQGWKCYKLNGNQCKTVSKTNRNPGRYSAHPKSCTSTKAPR